MYKWLEVIVRSREKRLFLGTLKEYDLGEEGEERLKINKWILPKLGSRKENQDVIIIKILINL